MTRAQSNTSRGGGWWPRHTSLCLALLIAIGLIWVGGCATAPTYSNRQMPHQSAVTHPAIVTPTNNEPIRAAAANEIDEETARAIPQIERPAPQPVDPGAAALLQAMLDRMGERIIGPEDTTRIGLSQLRNQSRASSAEFNEFRERFARLLNRAAEDARGAKVRFMCDADQDVEYQMQGAVYMISAGGFDLWEMFLSLTPSEKAWTVWEARNPLRVLRQPRPGQPQFVAW